MVRFPTNVPRNINLPLDRILVRGYHLIVLYGQLPPHIHTISSHRQLCSICIFDVQRFVHHLYRCLADIITFIKTMELMYYVLVNLETFIVFALVKKLRALVPIRNNKILI